MSLTGGKRKVNKGLKDWVTFVKKVQKEEKLSYKDAIHRAKIRKDKGEKWMSGGQGTTDSTTSSSMTDGVDMDDMGSNDMGSNDMGATMGGRKRRTMRRSLRITRGRGKTRSRGRGRASRRH